ncbi:MAG: hypothetical protein PVF43_10050, partial [Candidatus Eiseniibacteriota bacterium]
MMLDALAAAWQATAHAVVPWLVTYAVHSTLIMGIVLVAIRWIVRAPRSREWLLKMAIVGPLATTWFQMASHAGPLALGLPVLETSTVERAAGRADVLALHLDRLCERGATWVEDGAAADRVGRSRLDAVRVEVARVGAARFGAALDRPAGSSH